MATKKDNQKFPILRSGATPLTDNMKGKVLIQGGRPKPFVPKTKPIK